MYSMSDGVKIAVAQKKNSCSNRQRWMMSWKKDASASDKACFKMIAILRDLKNSDAMLKWCTSWELKHKESSKDMYK
ncbi:hypothetical protein OXX79_002263 [Metschnikowia pulcherrima]